MQKKYRREVLLRDPRFSQYQRDFLGVVLWKDEYAWSEAVKAVKAFFREKE